MDIVHLYKRDAKNNIICWNIQQNTDNTIIVSYGLFGHEPHVEFIRPTMKKANEIQSRINAKRKEGYKTVEDLYDNSPKSFDTTADLYAYLKTYLPKYNTTSEGFVLPMLAKTLEDNKPFEKCGYMLGQYKINGLRCIIGAEKIEDDMFSSYRFTYTSREGTRWNLEWMDECIMSTISEKLIEMMLEEGVCLDGELYLPGYSVNDIDSFVKNPSMPQHYKLQYWCYDIAGDNMTASYRYSLLTKYFVNGNTVFLNKLQHLENKKQCLLIPTYKIDNISHATDKRDLFINNGFEGLIIRNPDAEYAFGKRNSSMFKYKKKEDGLFIIIDIKSDKRGLPIYTLKNDINDEMFDCTINLPQDKQREQFAMRNILIGKKGLVEFRERSGVKQVPFHSKLIKVYI